MTFWWNNRIYGQMSIAALAKFHTSWMKFCIFPTIGTEWQLNFDEILGSHGSEYENVFWGVAPCNLVEDTAIYYLDLVLVFQPLRFEGWPRHLVNLLCWVQSIELASIGIPLREASSNDRTEPNRVGSLADDGRITLGNNVLAKHQDDG
jgi:hypothetical protein